MFCIRTVHTARKNNHETTLTEDTEKREYKQRNDLNVQINAKEVQNYGLKTCLDQILTDTKMTN